jgi:hypothetical protein
LQPSETTTSPRSAACPSIATGCMWR